MEGRKILGVKKSKPLKRIKNNKIRDKNRFSVNFGEILPAIVDYLKSDSYFYSHFVESSSSPSDFGAPFDVFFSSTGKPILGTEGSMKEKLVEYLKSDTYLYAPLEDIQHRNDFAVKTVISPPRRQELQFMRVTSTDFSKKIAWQTKKVAEIPVVEKGVDHSSEIPHDVSVISPQTPALQEVKKQVAHRVRSSRLSALSA